MKLREFQTASALHDALKKVKRSRKPAQFFGVIATVADPKVSLERRLKLTYRELRKLVRLPFVHPPSPFVVSHLILKPNRLGTSISGYAANSTASAMYRCRCSAPKVPSGSELPPEMTEVCKGTIEIVISTDHSHPRLPGERTTVRIVH
jgi:hypothetical protein